jgi:hypothetical protein
MRYRAKDLSTEQRQAVESLLRRPISEHECVSIKAIASPEELVTLSVERRKQALEKVRQYFARIDEKRAEISDSGADAIINEAIRSVRPRLRPID